MNSFNRIQEYMDTLHNESIGNTFDERYAILVLFHEGAMPMSTLSMMLQRGRSSTTFLVDRLEDQGVVQRQHSRDDRRVVNVALTTKLYNRLCEQWEHAA